MPLVAGIDSSTQSCKLVIRDAETGALVRSGRASHPNGTEVNPAAWVSALAQSIEQAGGLDDVAALSIGGQQHGMVLLDADGRVIRDALLWNDTRSAEQAQLLIEHFGAQYLAAETGSIPVASFTSTKVLWVAQNEPENAARIAAICLPHDYLTWRLAGYGPAGESQFGPDLNALTTDESDASGTGYYSAKQGGYVAPIIEWILGRMPILPRIVASNEAAYPANPQREVFKGLLGAGAGDNAAAGFGVGADNGDVVVSLGTSGTVFAVTDVSTADETGTIAGFASVSGSFLPLVCTLNAARILDSFCRVLEVDHHGLGELALQAEPGSGGVVLLPYFEGERTPNLPDAKASIHGLTLHNNTRANLARAAVEGMLCGLADGLAAMTAEGVKCSRVILVGGAAENPAVQKIAAQVFGVEICVPKAGEYVADGAARQAAWALLGTEKKWQIATEANVKADTQPVILQQYHSAFESIH
ncbi:MAG: hypothetical protein RL508_126 [Actinomycetota bacterium]|jgi:xylulokinase